MNDTPTPRTDAHQMIDGMAHDHLWRNFAETLERELTAVTEQRDEARRLAERYRNLSCDSQEEADETLLPWEITTTNEL